MASAPSTGLSRANLQDSLPNLAFAACSLLPPWLASWLGTEEMSRPTPAECLDPDIHGRIWKARMVDGALQADPIG